MGIHHPGVDRTRRRLRGDWRRLNLVNPQSVVNHLVDCRYPDDVFALLSTHTLHWAGLAGTLDHL